MITTVPIKNEKDIAVPDKTVLVLGYFDGIHKGHQKLFEVASKASMKEYLPVVVMTFTESPKLALQPYQPELMLHIVSHEEREHKMKWHGVEALFLLDFSSKFASLTGQEFFDTYVRALKPAIIVAGFDYTFGSDKKRSWSVTWHSSTITWNGCSWECSWTDYRLPNSKLSFKRSNLYASRWCLRSRY